MSKYRGAMSMSSSDRPQEQAERLKENDPYAAVERAAELAWRSAAEAVAKGEASRISDKAVVDLMTAAIKLYAAKADGEERTFRAVHGKYDEIVTPTEALTAVTEILRALQLGPMEFGLWSRRRPEDYHLQEPTPANESTGD